MQERNAKQEMCPQNSLVCSSQTGSDRTDRMWAGLMTIFTTRTRTLSKSTCLFYVSFSSYLDKYLSGKRKFQAHLSK